MAFYGWFPASVLALLLRIYHLPSSFLGMRLQKSTTSNNPGVSHQLEHGQIRNIITIGITLLGVHAHSRQKLLDEQRFSLANSRCTNQSAGIAVTTNLQTGRQYVAHPQVTSNGPQHGRKRT